MEFADRKNKNKKNTECVIKRACNVLCMVFFLFNDTKIKVYARMPTSAIIFHWAWVSLVDFLLAVEQFYGDFIYIKTFIFSLCFVFIICNGKHRAIDNIIEQARFPTSTSAPVRPWLHFPVKFLFILLNRASFRLPRKWEYETVFGENEIVYQRQQQ